MREKIKELNKILEPYYLLIIMIIFFIGGFVSLYKILFSPPDLLVRIEKENINYPSSINDSYIDIYSSIQDSSNVVDIKDKSVELYNYLIKTKHQRVIEIKNNTNKTIKSINTSSYQSLFSPTCRLLFSTFRFKPPTCRLFLPTNRLSHSNGR